MPDIDWSTLTGSSAVAGELCNIIFDLNLFQYVNQPTHIQGNTLDLMLSDSGNLIHSLSVVPSHQTPIHSDHHIITFNVSAGLVVKSKKVSRCYVYDFGAGYYPGLCSCLNNKPLEITRVENVEEIWTIIKEAVLGGIQKFILKHKRKPVLYLFGVTE